MTEEERKVWEHMLDMHFAESAAFVFAVNGRMAAMHEALHQHPCTHWHLSDNQHEEDR